MAAAVLALALRVLWLEPRSLRVRRLAPRLAGWPPALDGLRVVAVADLHAGAPHVGEERLARIADLVSAEAPDLVVLLGDYVDPNVAFGSTVEPEALVRPLGRLRARLGVFGVLGNHDWVNDGPRVAAALRAAGVRVLENDPARVTDGLWLAGMADLRHRKPDVKEALAAVPEDAACIALSHDPDLFPEIPQRVALTLAGHTHGAQLNVPLLRRLVTPSRFGARYIAGWSSDGRKRMYVSRGVGTSGLPVRFRAPPELVVLDLFAPSPSA